MGRLSARTRVRAVLLLLVPVALTLFAASPVHAAGLRFGPLPHSDARDAAGGPLDITRVTFGQQETRIVLSLRTAESWSASDLVAATGRELCLELFAGERSTARARICVAARGDRTAVLRYIGLDSAGEPTAAHTLAAGVRRPDRRTLEARLTPAAINLPLGRTARSSAASTSCRSARSALLHRKPRRPWPSSATATPSIGAVRSLSLIHI